MLVEFGRMRHGEIRQAAELATRAFDDYEYFTNWFPDKEERNRVQFAMAVSSFSSQTRRRTLPSTANLATKYLTIAPSSMTERRWEAGA